MTKKQKRLYTDSPAIIFEALKQIQGRKVKLDCGHHGTIRPGHAFVQDIMLYLGDKKAYCSLCSY
jgi:hypothetical protein